MPRCSGFTLIELLVVVTIIVVLLAMLTPALDRAIYEAEMTVCMAQHSGISKGATTYAMGYKRFYPHRPTMQNENGCFERIQSGLTGAGGNDDRPVLRQFMGVKMLQCPLNGEVSLDTPSREVWILPSTLLWFGGRGIIDKTGKRNRPIAKVGDKLGWEGQRHPSQDPAAGSKRWRFDYLTSETDWTRLNDEVRTAHADDEGILQNETLEAESVFLVVNGVRSRWIARGTSYRGLLQQNYGRADGSVRRINDIAWHDPEQTVELPEFENGDNFWDNAEHLPVD